MPRDQILQATLDLMVLKTLSRNGVMHGYGIAGFIQQVSREALRVEEGSLYPALYRLELEDLIVSEWGHAASGRRGGVLPAECERAEAAGGGGVAMAAYGGGEGLVLGPAG